MVVVALVSLTNETSRPLRKRLLTRTLLVERRGVPVPFTRSHGMIGMDVLSFGQLNFGALDLGDVRRARRLAELADLMSRHPGGSLPEKLPDPPDLRAFYRLMDTDEVTHEVLMGGHTAATRQAMAKSAEAGHVLLILHDATELDYTTLRTLKKDLGQIGQGTHRGYICHNSFVVQAEPQMALGLSSQILHHRANVPAKETSKEHRERKSRESRLWVTGAKQSGPAPAGSLCVDVSDSLSDTFEYMAFEVKQGRNFVLRSRENRKLDGPLENAEAEYLYPTVRRQRSVATRVVEVQATVKHKARQAKVNVSFTPVRIAPPSKRQGEYDDCPLDLWAVRVWEPNPPKNAEPLEWILLTNVPVDSAKAAIERVEWYEARWVIEDFHKGMKTGCGIEIMQFTKITRMEPAIAVLSALATTLLKVRDAARQPDADVRPATDVVAEEYVAVLAAHYRTRLTQQPTILQFYMHVARLGGHQNRKQDGFPGWITLWRGWMKLEDMVTGHRLGRARGKKLGIT